MTAPAGFQSLFVNQAQSFAQSVVHRDRRRMMIGAVVAPVALDHRDVKIPTLYFRAPRANAIQGAFVESDRRKARRRADALLRPGVTDVDAVAINPYGMTGQRRYSIED